jgi:hypothetical protein
MTTRSAKPKNIILRPININIAYMDAQARSSSTHLQRQAPIYNRSNSMQKEPPSEPDRSEGGVLGGRIDDWGSEL